MGAANGGGVGEAGVRKADRVARELLGEITHGEPAVGAVLPNEGELATRFAVNRSVVREAIKLLEVHKLVRPVRRRGTVVLDPFASLSPEVLSALLRRRDGTVDVSFLASLLEIRAELDAWICGLAAERRTRGDLDALASALEIMRAGAGDAGRYAEATFDFGLALARATHNPIALMLSHWNRAVVRDLPEIFGVPRASTGPHLEGLATLLERIRARDAEHARALVRAFHEWASPRIVAAAELQNGAPLASGRARASKTTHARPTTGARTTSRASAKRSPKP